MMRLLLWENIASDDQQENRNFIYNEFVIKQSGRLNLESCFLFVKICKFKCTLFNIKIFYREV